MIGSPAGPQTTASYAIRMEDPDTPGGTFTHGVAWNFTGTRIDEGIARSEQKRLRQAESSFGNPGYSGPCPPEGMLHDVFRVYAIGGTLELA